LKVERSLPRDCNPTQVKRVCVAGRYAAKLTFGKTVITLRGKPSEEDT